ncbi:hypothetical protein DYI37_03215 [Fulvimarina endophytica]|uniref:HNH nuclease domain-containing protein n=1 Tax=Fulvimarina endophytica TaxID=2293836 RepID=A0A371XB43_9HYPH|nr:HNH endonuclease [Fulvimarina endophytica]RFC66465.1 hypothetical protein DYI37_03215 [Fulvimarina endophytica]
MTSFDHPFNRQRRWAIKQAKMLEQEGQCFYCGQALAIYHAQDGERKADCATIDHLIPKSERPELRRVMSNVVLACAACNAAKGVKSAGQYMAEVRAR